ncbi:MAG TPA: AMP-binding protein [Xanthobacteraceae bacterium]|nr:AMP-binding protein [Xanthobacteraceae bacterium]
MEKIWLKSYPPSVPPTVDVTAYRSIGDVFDMSVAKFGARLAYVNMGSALSYAVLGRLAQDFAAYLQADLGLPRGARVALMMPNILQYPVALFGALRAGYAVVNCNPLYTPRELAHQLEDSGAEAIVVLENFAAALAQAIGRTRLRHVIVTRIGDLFAQPKRTVVNLAVKHFKRMVPAWDIPGAVAFRAALRRGARREFLPVDVGPDDIAFLQYTGGTTGVPKGAVLTHGNIVANLQQGHAWLKPCLEEAREVVITALPLYHIFALTTNCLLFQKIGGTNILITNPRDITGLVKELGKHRFSVITGVNTLFNALLNHPGFAQLDFSALRVAVGGGMAVQQSVAERWKQVTGKTLIEGYGLTEASPLVAANPLDLAEYNGAVGLPLPSTDIAVRDENGRDLRVGAVGELCVRGPQVMQGYWNRPDETANVMTADGFLRTGDMARVDEDGFVRIVDRKKDLILVSGFNVYPNEIEDVVALHPGVLEVGAIGVPDEMSGEAIKIVIVRRDPNLTPTEIIAHCRARLTRYKIPRHVEFRTELPKTNLGKVLRRALHDAGPIAA